MPLTGQRVKLPVSGKDRDGCNLYCLLDVAKAEAAARKRARRTLRPATTWPGTFFPLCERAAVRLRPWGSTPGPGLGPFLATRLIIYATCFVTVAVSSLLLVLLGDVEIRDALQWLTTGTGLLASGLAGLRFAQDRRDSNSAKQDEPD